MRTLALIALLVVAALGAALPASAAKQPRTPIKHFITILQENHTFDNYFGTYPGADGIPEDLCMPANPLKRGGQCIRPFHIGDNDIVPRDLDHSTETALRQIRSGRMDGFVHALDLRNQDGRLALGYYDDRDLPFYWNLADEYVLFDRFFSSINGGSFLNHVYWVAASPLGGADRIPDQGIDGTTIFDRLDEAGISWKFYVQNYEPRLNYRTLRRFPGNRASQVIWVPLLNIPRYLDDPKLFSKIVPLDEYYEDLVGGTLPNVAYIAPSGPSEHPPSSIESGQAFVRTLMNALISSDYWKSSAFLLAYDDWGGWYDHVAPPKVDEHGYGMRVPAILVSPYAKRGVVDSTVLDFASILKFIEENWRLKPVAERDAKAKSFMSAFDFTKPPRPAQFTSPRREQLETANIRIWVIYALYGGSLALPSVFITYAAISRALRLRRLRGEEA